MATPEYIINTERTRLDPRTERTGTTTDIGTTATFLTGTLLACFGAVILLVGLQILPYPASSILAPYWVLSTIGGFFLLGGIALWLSALREHLHRRKILAAKGTWCQIHADFPWNPLGVSKSPWAKVVQSFFPLLAFLLILAPFHWWGWHSANPSLILIILLILFDLVYLFGIWEFLRRILAACRYGRSRLEYGKFPFATGERVDLRWLPPSGLTTPDRISCTLRCVKEWYEWEGMAGDRSKRLQHTQLWSATRTAIGDSSLAACGRTWLTFEVPDTVPGTDLAAGEHVFFWEFEVAAEVVGVDFTERYLVPVYSGR